MSATSCAIYLVFVFGLVCQIPAVGSTVLWPFLEGKTPVRHATLNAHGGTSETYQSIVLVRFRGMFIRTSTRKLQDHSVLHDQTAKNEEPFMFIAVTVVWDDTDETTLLFRADNMYFMGWATKEEIWYALEGYEKMIPGSIPTGISADYGALGGRDNLHTVPLGMGGFESFIRNMSRPLVNKVHMKISVNQILIMFPEAVRFFPIREKILQGWETGSFLQTDAEKDLLVCWRDISFNLLKWSKTNVWPSKGIRSTVVDAYGIHTGEAALGIVDPIMMPLNFRH